MRLPELQAGSALAEQTRSLPEFTLIDHTGKTFGKERFIGHWTFLFFGYTHCPDVCPTTLTALNRMMKSINEQQRIGNLQVLFVSVDPQRDSTSRLAQYVSYFNPDFIGATGDSHLLQNLAGTLGIAYAKLPSSSGDPTDYLMDHGASVLLIGPYGTLRAVFSPPFDAKALASDFLTLYRHSGT